ncbi:MAG: hypothetical protein JST36_00465 [Bacteroidetes bacterium]|nr:hypothetical protein [Bacteroidota bacterium]
MPANLLGALLGCNHTARAKNPELRRYFLESVHRYFLPVLLSICSLWSSAFAQSNTTTAKAKKQHLFYISWGYNQESYTRSDLHVKQASLGNDYTFHSVKSEDNKGWDKDFFSKALTIPQYSYRIGYMFDEARGLGVELNFDHTKHIISNDQMLHMTGTFNGKPVDTNVLFASTTGFHYYLNNGANFFLFNFVKRIKRYDLMEGKFRLDGLLKAGVGPVVPHVDNMLFGQQNDPGFQFGGWNVGLEADLKLSVFKYVYLEYGLKLDYARYSSLKVYEGRAREAFGTFEQILSLGLQLPSRR